jgi:fibronectin-binding autotransporter adhesin
LRYHTGGTTLNGGTLLIGSNTSVRLDEIVLNSGFLGFVSGSNTLTRSFTINQSDSGFTAVNAGDILTVSGNITGSGTLNKQGNGTLILTGTNTFTGGLNIRSGNLEVAAGSALGSGVITNDRALTIRTNSDTSLASVITGSGSLTKAGSGTLLLTGSNSYTGGTSIQGGVLAVGNDHALGNGTVTLSGSTLRASGDARKLNNAVTIVSPSTLSSGNVSTANPQTPGLMLTGGVTLASDGPLTITGNTRVAITGVLGEDGTGRTLIKDGAGTLVLTNDNTYTGGTFVRAGTLVVNNAYNRVARGSGTGEGAVTVGRGATLTGTFAISGGVQVNSGGALGIGNSIGASSVSTLTLAGGSLLQFEIGDDGISSDRLDVTGLLTKSGSGPITFLLSGEQQADGSQKALSEGTFTLLTFSAASGVSVNDFATAGLTPDWASRFTFTGPTWDNGGMKPGTLAVTLSHTPAALAAPEPTSLLFLLAAGGLGGISIACRRRKGRAGAIA